MQELERDGVNEMNWFETLKKKGISGGPPKIPYKKPRRGTTATGYEAELEKLLRDWENGKITNDEYEKKKKALKLKYGR